MSVKGRAETPQQKRDIIEKLYAMWVQYPDLRLGQLIQNAVDGRGRDVFYIEDEDLISALRFFRQSFPPAP